VNNQIKTVAPFFPANLMVLQRAVLWAGLLLASMASGLRADIIIDSYTAATNDRFTNSGAFIASAFSLSGVGQDASGRWATAISRNVIITAQHFPASGAVNFYADNNPLSAPVIRNIVSGVVVPGTDLYLAVLDSELPASIVHFGYATQALAGPNGQLANAGIYQNLNAYLFGRSPEPHPIFRDQAIGRNRITGYVENVAFNGNPDNDSLIMFYESVGNPDYVQYEAYLQVGDSGAPLFVEIGGQLRLLGINSFINSGGLGGNPPFFSGITYTGNQAAFITNYINAVPEPGSSILIALGSLGFVLRRRRTA
jgi:hypothetical protein